MPTPRPPYPAAFRQQMVELARAGRSVSELAREFGCNASSIHAWVKAAGGLDGSGGVVGSRSGGIDSHRGRRSGVGGGFCRRGGRRGGDWRRSRRLFLLGAGGQGQGSDQGSQNERLVHVKPQEWEAFL